MSGLGITHRSGVGSVALADPARRAECPPRQAFLA